jgi:hypothetical protein
MNNSEPLVLSEEESIELLAFLVTAARTQVDEPHDYGPLRLLTAAERLSRHIMNRVAPESQDFIKQILDIFPEVHNYRMSDTEKYIGGLDELCRAVAQHLIERTGIEKEAS